MVAMYSCSELARGENILYIHMSKQTIDCTFMYLVPHIKGRPKTAKFWCALILWMENFILPVCLMRAVTTCYHEKLRDMAVLRVLLLALCVTYSAHCHVLADKNDYWEIKNQTGILDGQSLRLRKLNHPNNTYHSCYEITCSGTECTVPSSNETAIEVCYPAVVVSGLSKCGTSAMYDLLSKFPRAITMRKKENCPYNRGEPLWLYFQSLLRMSSIGEHALVIDGCINVGSNIAIRELLRNPNTHYVMMVRDYADRRWSAYNFWCNERYDDVNCTSPNNWTDPALHKRSPELFHSSLLASKSNARGDHCANGLGYYSKSYHQLQRNRHHNQTIIVANEELDLYPFQVAQRVASFIHCNIDGMDLSAFEKVRLNTQENKGTNNATGVNNYVPGLYKISNYQSLLPESRALLYKCWYEDCIALSKIPPYYKYTACFPEYSANNVTLSSNTTTTNRTNKERRLVLPNHQLVPK